MNTPNGVFLLLAVPCRCVIFVFIFIKDQNIFPIIFLLPKFNELNCQQIIKTKTKIIFQNKLFAYCVCVRSLRNTNFSICQKSNKKQKKNQ